MKADLEARDELPCLIAKRLPRERDQGTEQAFKSLEVLAHAFMIAGAA